MLDRGGHGLAAGLINIPGVNTLRVNFDDCPGKRVFANAGSQLGAAFRREFFGIVEADDAALGIEDDGGSDNGAKQRAAAGFIDACDASPAELARRSLETGRAKSVHELEGILACRDGENAGWKEKLQRKSFGKQKRDARESRVCW